ncbi:Mucolipin-3, partial [Stegodyphus mimosarum]
MMTSLDVPVRNSGRSQESEAEVRDEFTSLLQATKNRDISNTNYGGVASSFDEQSDVFVNQEYLMTTREQHGCSSEILKRRLKYFFMNPIDKWRTKGKFPWKLLLQIVKIVFVTLQLCVFGTDGYIYELQKQHTASSFRHIFLLGWTPLRDVVSYPPSTGPYAVYTKPEFFQNIDYVIKTYANITNLALGTYCYDGPNCTMTNVSFCREEFKTMMAFNSSVTFDGRPQEICHAIPDLYPDNPSMWSSFSIKEYLLTLNDSVSFDRLISAQLTFVLKTIFLKSLGNNKYPDCYGFKIIITYNNGHDGQMIVTLDTHAQKLHCYHNGVINPSDLSGYISRQILNCFNISVSVLSILLCCRCLAKARILCEETDKYFKLTQNKALTAPEKMEFLDMWYVVIIINDILIISGSVLKAAIEQRSVESDQYATCAILLGSANLLVWSGVLRYLGFFSKYNILILTLKRA